MKEQIKNILASDQSAIAKLDAIARAVNLKPKNRYFFVWWQYNDVEGCTALMTNNEGIRHKVLQQTIAQKEHLYTPEKLFISNWKEVTKDDYTTWLK